MGENSFKARTGQLGPVGGIFSSDATTAPMRETQDRRAADNGRDIVISNAGNAGGEKLRLIRLQHLVWNS